MTRLQVASRVVPVAADVADVDRYSRFERSDGAHLADDLEERFVERDERRDIDEVSRGRQVASDPGRGSPGRL